MIRSLYLSPENSICDLNRCIPAFIRIRRPQKQESQKGMETWIL